MNQAEKAKNLELQEYYIERAFGLSPNSPVVLKVKGWVHGAKGELDKQYESFKKSLEINPNHPQGSAGAGSMGYFLFGHGLCHQAIPYFTKAIELDPLTPETYYIRGLAYRVIGNIDQALVEYQKALEINPNYINALLWSAEVYIFFNNYREAEMLLAKAERLNPDSPNWRPFKRPRGILYAVQGEKGKALGIKESTVYLFLEMKDEAIRCLENEIASFPSRYSSYLWLINSPYCDSIRNDPRFIDIVEKQKQIYDENLRKYGDIELN